MSALLKFIQQPPVDWAETGRFGEGGTFGDKIQASGVGTRNYVMHYDLLQMTSGVSLLTKLRMKSSLVAASDGTQGFAIRHRGFRIKGAAPAKEDEQVWDSNPLGSKSWISAPFSDWRTKAFLVNVPDSLGIDYVTWEGVVNATSGEVIISNRECRYAYTKPLPDVARKEFSTFTGSAMESRYVVVSEGVGIFSTHYLSRQLSRYTTNIEIGKQVQLSANCGAGASEVLSGGSRTVTRVAVLARFEHEGGTYTKVIAEGVATSPDHITLLGQTLTFRALDNITAISIHVGARSDVFGDHDSVRLEYGGLRVEGNASEFIAPSQ